MCSMLRWENFCKVRSWTSRRWDLHISPETFYFTISMKKDVSSFARRSFLDKTHKLLKDRAIPSRYACSYALAFSDCLKDIRDDRAEDVVDVEKTPKLHLLADIGFSFVTAVNQSGISSSHAPGHVLLPSSLYRLQANSRCLTQSCFDECFAKRVIHVFKSHSTSEHASYLSKRGRKYLEDSTQSGSVEDSHLTLASSKRYLRIGKTAERQNTGEQEITVGRKRAVSPNAPVSVQLHKCSKKDRHVDVSEKSGLSSEKEQLLSSSGSVPVKPSLAGSHVSTQNPKRSSASLKESIGVSSSGSAEYSKANQTNVKAPCSLKETSSKGEALIGTRIKLLSPTDRCFHSGTVDGYNPENNKHKIACDNGAVELVCLDSESWETLSDDSQLERRLPIGLVSSISSLVNRNGTCWVQHKIERFVIDPQPTPSIPVKFLPILPDEDEVIRESTFLNIQFPDAAVSYVCVDSLWKVINRPDQVFGQQFVVVGDNSGFTNPGWFKIERYSEQPLSQYKLLWCPVYVLNQSVRSSDDCQTIRIFADSDGIERLALADTSVPIGFRASGGPQSDQHLKMSISNA